MAMLTEAMDLIESRELDVVCRMCAWTDSRTISWLLSHRDMECPSCLGIIVLNTSEMKDRVKLLRRQVTELRRHLRDSIPDSAARLEVRAPGIRAVAPRAHDGFALRMLYGETSGRFVNSPRQVRRERR